jgi:purine nucleosidase
VDYGMSNKIRRIIIDTDIGSDPDDAVALALAMRSPELFIEGITTVYGDVDLRARLAKKMLCLGGFGEVPIYTGISQSLLRNRDVWWGGHEGEGILEGDEPTESSGHAVDFIVDTVMNNPGQITLVAIGPLANIATALIREPAIADNVKEILMMGGVTRLGENGKGLPVLEHNIKCDPEAASIVFSSGAPIVMVGLDVTMNVIIERHNINRLSSSNQPLNLVVSKLLEKWLDICERDYTAMHDPLAVSYLIDKSILQTERMKVTVDYDHRQPSGMTIAVPSDNGNVQVCLGVNAEQFIKLLMNRLIGKE